MHQDSKPEVPSNAAPPLPNEEDWKRNWERASWDEQDGADECHRALWMQTRFYPTGALRPAFDSLTYKERYAWLAVYKAAVNMHERAKASNARIA